MKENNEKLFNKIIGLQNEIYELQFKVKYLEKLGKLKWWQFSDRKALGYVMMYDAPCKLTKGKNYGN